MAKSQQNTHQEGKPSRQTGQTNRRATGNTQTDERSIRREGETPNRPGKIGGQGMGQGRGMNPGEVHEPAEDNDNDQKGGDRSDRAARNGASGDRNTGGGRNKPAPKDQDEKGTAHRRNQ